MTPSHMRSLFGGALVSAGLAVAAHAQQFTFGYSDVRTDATEYAFFTNDYDTFFGTGPFSMQSLVSNNYATAYATVSAGPTQIRSSASVTGNGGFAYGYDYFTDFTVDQNVNADVNWDWSQSLGLLSVFDLTNSTSLFFDSGTGSGSTQIPLIAGDQYRVSGFTSARGEGTLSTYWQIDVPAPGSAGLLGIAGLIAARRGRPTPDTR